MPGKLKCTKGKSGHVLWISVVLISFIVGLRNSEYCLRILPVRKARSSADSANVKLRNLRVAGAHVYAMQPPSLRVHVYDLPDEFERELLRKYDECHSYQWAFETRIPELLRKRYPPRSDPGTADFYLVPFPVKCFNNFVAKHDKRIVERKYLSLLDWLRTEFPWFDRSGGMDHIFIFPSGQGAQIFPSSSMYLKNSIFLVAEGDRSKNYSNTFKDIVVPGFSSLTINDTRQYKRYLLAVFRGSTIMSIATEKGKKIQRKNELRTALMKELKDKENIIFSDQRLESHKYSEELYQTKFIICPRGITPWTRRVFDGMFAGAVPVIISDDVEFPFEADIDWSLFTVKIAEKHAIKQNFLANKLQELVNDGTHRSKAANLEHFRHNFDWEREEVLNGILWQLHRRRRIMKHGSLRVWN